jgi:hypothetical protein
VGFPGLTTLRENLPGGENVSPEVLSPARPPAALSPDLPSATLPRATPSSTLPTPMPQGILPQTPATSRTLKFHAETVSRAPLNVGLDLPRLSNDEIVVDDAKEEDREILRLLRQNCTDPFVTGIPDKLMLEHLGNPTAENQTFCMDWLNKVARLERHRHELMQKDPKKAVRNPKHELSELIDVDCWTSIELQSHYTGHDIRSSKMNLFILNRIIEIMNRNAAANVGNDPITYDKVKHIAEKWNDKIKPAFNYVNINSSLNRAVKSSNQELSSDTFLQLLFSLMPERFTRYLLTMLANVKHRNYEVGPTKSPMDRVEITDDQSYYEHVNSVKKLGQLIYDQLEFVGEIYPTFNDPDTFQGMKNNTFPSRNTNQLILHLFPISGSVGAKRLSNLTNVKAHVAEVITPTKTPVVNATNKRRYDNDNRSEKKKRYDTFVDPEENADKPRKCYNCMQPGHEAFNCDRICRSVKCLGLPGAPTHAAKSCPIRLEHRTNVRRN